MADRVWIALLRGVNVTGCNMIKMEALRAMCASLGCSDVQTYVQSGNVVFRSAAKDAVKLGKTLEDGIEKTFGFRVPVVLRSAADLARVVEQNPFPEQAKAEPSKLLVSFLYVDPGEARREQARAMTFSPEVLRFEGREVYVFYPVGQGLSKLKWGPIDKVLGTPGTMRNWNTVIRLLAMAEGLEG